MTAVRSPAVAGQFYPEAAMDLEAMIASCNTHRHGPGDMRAGDGVVYGVVSPHAGYMYSGPTACHAYRSVSRQSPELVVIVGPNHYGIGKDAATMTDARWETPLGTVGVDSEAARSLSSISKAVEIDFHSHSRDHSLEVQIPMLQSTFPNGFEILPIILLSQDRGMAEDVGKAISEIARRKRTIIVASSDFTHYEEQSFARSQDMALIEPILDMDVGGFYDVLERRRVSACGYGAIASVMTACRRLGATRGMLLSYATSGDVTGDTGSVVGYGAIKFV